MVNNRLIMYHKQSASARIVFFALNGSVCHFDGLPPDAKIVSRIEDVDAACFDYPQTLIPSSQERLGLSNNILEIEKPFRAIALSAALTFNIYLARFTTVDPPQEPLANLNGKFMTLLEARSLPTVEIELLGLAYSFLMD